MKKENLTRAHEKTRSSKGVKKMASGGQTHANCKGMGSAIKGGKFKI